MTSRVGGKIERGHPGTAAGEGAGELTGAGGDVEGDGTGTNRGNPNGGPHPARVLTEGNEGQQRAVEAGNAVEQAVGVHRGPLTDRR